MLQKLAMRFVGFKISELKLHNECNGKCLSSPVKVDYISKELDLFRLELEEPKCFSCVVYSTEMFSVENVLGLKRGIDRKGRKGCTNETEINVRLKGHTKRRENNKTRKNIEK
jgi:hypothetical protein